MGDCFCACEARSRRRSMSIRYALVVGVAVMTTSALLAETKIERSQLPAAVEKTVQQETQGATIKGFSKERENGVEQYEVETVVDGHTRDMDIAKDGTVLEVEEEVAMSTLPSSVQSSIQARANGAQVTKVESMKKKGKLVAYEASTVKNGKKGEFQVGPNGEKLAHEE